MSQFLFPLFNTPFNLHPVNLHRVWIVFIATRNNNLSWAVTIWPMQTFLILPLKVTINLVLTILLSHRNFTMVIKFWGLYSLLIIYLLIYCKISLKVEHHRIPDYHKWTWFSMFNEDLKRKWVRNNCYKLDMISQIKKMQKNLILFCMELFSRNVV